MVAFGAVIALVLESSMDLLEAYFPSPFLAVVIGGFSWIVSRKGYFRASTAEEDDQYFSYGCLNRTSLSNALSDVDLPWRRARNL